MDVRARLLFLSAMFFLLVSCDKYIEDDISNEHVVMLSPADGVVTHETTITFWWEEMDEASKYVLQVATPSFESAIRLVVDTTMTETMYEYDFTPNSYECRVRAENSGSETEYIYRTFTIDSSMFLNNKKVELLKPLNNSYLQSSTIMFSWSSLPNTDTYQFALKDKGNSGVNVVDPFGTVATGFDLSTKYSDEIPEGEYVWRVQAENALSSSITAEYSFIVDRTPPEMPKLLTPNANDSIVHENSSVELSWQQGTDNFEIAYDSVFVYKATDSVAKNKVLVKKGSGINQKFATGNLDAKYWYYWSVVSYDKAGNATKETGAGRVFYLKK